MKQSEISRLFILICIAVLLASYGVGLGVRKIRFAGVDTQASATADQEKQAAKPGSDDEEVVAEEGTTFEEVTEVSPEEPTEEVAAQPERPEGGRRGMMGEGMRERFQNMSEEERQEAMARMRERFGGRGRGGGEGRGGGPFSQLSEEDQANLRAELEELGARAGEMSDEERQQARTEIFEKYGITPRGGGRPGGGGRRGARE